MTLETVTIYIELLDEGSPTFRPVQAESIGGDKYTIVSVNSDPDDEKWKFSTGDTVRCKKQKLSDGEYLVGIERVSTKT